MSKEHQATEQLSFEQVLAMLPETEAHLAKILARLARVRAIEPGEAVLDVGAAQGLLVLCCSRKGLQAVGVEPWDEARRLAQRLAEFKGAPISMVPGTAEALPCRDEQFDFVHANSVIEHVADAQAAFGEIFRVLKPGGVLWFSAASSLCPRQAEIAGFPLFGWYPGRLKRRIMLWAKVKRPHLIGHTDMPALNWFTPGKARRMLRRAGFRRVWDRWDLRLPSEGGWLHALALRIIRSNPVTKLLADVWVTACSYAALK